MDASAQLVRVCLAADGRTKATFEDNSVLLLNASGSAYVHCPPDGQQASHCTQLCEYAISRYAPKVAVALEFRNMHVDVPYYCSMLKRCGSSPAAQGLQLGYQLLEVWWPATAAEAWSSGLATVSADNNSITLSSTDSSARMVLHGHGQRFAVSYPLLIGQDGTGQYQYVWQTQVFSMTCYPSRWEAAVSLLQAVAQHAVQHGTCVNSTSSCTAGSFSSTPLCQPGSCSNTIQVCIPQQLCSEQQHAQALTSPCSTHRNSCRHSITQGNMSEPVFEDGNQSAMVIHSQYTGPCPHEQQPGGTHHPCVQPPCTQLPDISQQPCSRVCDGFEQGSWWFEPSLTLLPASDLLSMEWTPAATYQFIPDTQEVQAWVHANASCICSEKQGRFIRHTMACTRPSYGSSSADSMTVAVFGPGDQQAALPWQQEMLYSASCVPEQTWCGEGSQLRIPLGQLTAHALKFREQMVSVLRSAVNTAQLERLAHSNSNSLSAQLAGAPADDTSFLVQSEEVLECVEQAGQGSFTAYADGRVRAFFEDRTIMHLNTQHTHCKVILPDGKVIRVTTSNPVGVERHMQALLDFCRWAFTAPVHREAALHARHAAHVQAAASHRMAQLLEWSLARPKAGSTGAAAATQPQGHAMQLRATVCRTPWMKADADAWKGGSADSGWQSVSGACIAAGTTAGTIAAGATAGITAVRRAAPQVVDSPSSVGMPAGHAMHAMVQQLLQRNAELIGKL